ncbi:MAG: DUF3990 domain-containing protein [Thermoguttaceae bacterium]|nr:DUF3990 domain-containing protein [Thermoguttaceae bacterium]
MRILVLFHGSANREVKPTYGLGDEKHDYGKGFYLTDNLDLAKEWAVCRPDMTNGRVRRYSSGTTFSGRIGNTVFYQVGDGV